MRATLAGLGHDVLSALEAAPGATDDELLALALAEQRILVTEDKDFGELVFVRRFLKARISLRSTIDGNSELPSKPRWTRNTWRSSARSRCTSMRTSLCPSQHRRRAIYRTAAAGHERGANGCDPVAVSVLLEAAGGGAILLRQRFRPGGMLPLGRSWQAVDSSVDDAHSRRSGDGVIRLLWRAGDIVALLQADGASLGALVRIAESVGLVPSRSR